MQQHLLLGSENPLHYYENIVAEYICNFGDAIKYYPFGIYSFG